MVRSTQALQSWYMALFQLPVLPEVLVKKTGASMLRAPGPDAGRGGAVCGPDGRAGSGDRRAELVPRHAVLAHMVATPKVRVPTTYAWGEKDPALGRAAAEPTADYVTGPYAFEVLKAGHWLPEKQPDEVASLILARVRDA